LREFCTNPPTLDGKNVAFKRQEIRNYFHKTFDLFEKVFEVLKDDEVFYQKSEPTRHPMLFYFGHTATFFINKLILMKIIQERINPHFESIFAVGVDEMAWDDLSENNYKWPKVGEVREYRNEVRTLVDNLITHMPLTLPITQDSGMWIVLMCIEHERIHVETSLVLHRQMPLEFVKNVEAFIVCDEVGEAPKNELIHISTCRIKLGKEKSHNLYGWDNEYGNYEELVQEFQASKYLVSNGEFMEFVACGGYENLDFWDDEGKKFLEIRKAKHPPFWVFENGEYQYRTLTSHIHMPQNWPVDVNALEAEAFCRYKSQKEGVTYTLPSEAEYAALTRHVEIDSVEIVEDKDANLNLSYFSSCPVDKFMFKEFGDVVGNVWQWSRTPIFGFDGFEIHEAYDDFSTPTFDNKHAIIKGSSWASSGNLIMKHARYAFRKHFYQNAGFRYVISGTCENDNKSDYQDAEVQKICQEDYTNSFKKECVQIALRFANKKTKALDLGCATGRSSFELAKEFEKVEGIDFSARFIQVGVMFKEKNTLACGNKIFDLQKLGYDTIKEKVSFYQGDANNLKPNFNAYDLVIATNTKERFYEPKGFLQDVHNRINKEGILVLILPNEVAIGNELDKYFELIHEETKESSKVRVFKKV
jgi:5-histidylcysteine sulfoxide synthase